MEKNESDEVIPKENILHYKELTPEERDYLIAEAREKNLKDENSRLLAAETQGEARGEARGEIKGILKSAQKMILAGSDVNFVKNALELSDEYMRKINEELSKGK